MNEREIFTKALSKMPSSFTSTEFRNELVKLGLRRSIEKPIWFLRENAIYDKAYKFWTKPVIQSKAMVKTPIITYNSESVEASIKFLKSAGYKVYKKVETWEEI